MHSPNIDFESQNKTPKEQNIAQKLDNNKNNLAQNLNESDLVCIKEVYEGNRTKMNIEELQE